MYMPAPHLIKLASGVYVEVRVVCSRFIKTLPARFKRSSSGHRSSGREGPSLLMACGVTYKEVMPLSKPSLNEAKPSLHRANPSMSSFSLWWPRLQQPQTDHLLHVPAVQALQQLLNWQGPKVIARQLMQVQCQLHVTADHHTLQFSDGCASSSGTEAMCDATQADKLFVATHRAYVLTAVTCTSPLRAGPAAFPGTRRVKGHPWAACAGVSAACQC